MTTDVFSKEKRSAVMARVKGRDTAPEIIVRRLFRRLGAGYRLHRRDLPGSPDIVMAGRKLAIFVHGCFWHGHDCPRGARVPKANRERDDVAQAALTARGWRVLTVWECELKDAAALETRLREVLNPV